MAKLVRPEDFKNRVLISTDLEVHRAHIQHYVDMGFDEVHLHNVGRNQAEFIEVFGREVLPNLRLDVDDDATPMDPETTPEPAARGLTAAALARLPEPAGRSARSAAPGRSRPGTRAGGGPAGCGWRSPP